MKSLNLNFLSTNMKFVPAIFLSLSMLFSNTAFAQSWTQIGTGPNTFNGGALFSMFFDGSGNLYAAGSVNDTNGYDYVAKWNGSTWSELGTGSNALNAGPFSVIERITMDNSGNIYAAGEFTNSSGKEYVAKWNDTNWSELGTGANALNANDYIHSVLTDASGNVYAAGDFTNSSGKTYVAKWNGTNWSELGTGANALNTNHGISKIIFDGSGNMYAAGYFTNTAGNEYVAKWNGTNWSELGTGTNALKANDLINALAADASGNIYAAGSFSDTISSISGHKYVAKWNGTTWAKVGTGANSEFSDIILSIVINSAGKIYIAGDFVDLNSTKYVSMWNGSNWSELGTGTNALNASSLIMALALDATGAIYATGYFQNSLGQPYVAKYGTTSGVPNTLNRQNRLQVFPNPASDAFTFKIDDKYNNAEVYISDVTGKEVYHSTINNMEHSVNISKWGNGIYICIIDIDNEKTISKIVVNH